MYINFIYIYGIKCCFYFVQNGDFYVVIDLRRDIQSLIFSLTPLSSSLFRQSFSIPVEDNTPMNALCTFQLGNNS
jgi:hypothetical protein